MQLTFRSVAAWVATKARQAGSAAMARCALCRLSVLSRLFSSSTRASDTASAAQATCSSVAAPNCCISGTSAWPTKEARRTQLAWHATNKGSPPDCASSRQRGMLALSRPHSLSRQAHVCTVANARAWTCSWVAGTATLARAGAKRVLCCWDVGRMPPAVGHVGTAGRGEQTIAARRKEHNSSVEAGAMASNGRLKGARGHSPGRPAAA